MKTALLFCLFSLLGVVLLRCKNDVYPKGWYKYGEYPKDFRIDIDNRIAYHGQKSGFIESVSEKPSGFCTLMQTFNDEKYSNKRVKMTGYIKAEGTIDTALMWVRVDDLNKKIKADFDNMQNRPIIGTTDWIKCEIIFDMPDSKSNILFGFILSGPGKAWADNVSFEVVDSTYNKTAAPINLPLLPNTELYPFKANNLDFED